MFYLRMSEQNGKAGTAASVLLLCLSFVHDVKTPKIRYSKVLRGKVLYSNHDGMNVNKTRLSLVSGEACDV